MTRHVTLLTPLTAAALATLLAAAPLAAQRSRDRDRDRDRDEWNDDREQAASRIDTVVPFRRDGAVELSLTSGQIAVTGWDRAEVRINAVSEQGDLRLDLSGSRLSLEERSRRRGGDARYEVTVPTGTRVLMRSASGDLLARGVKGEVEARSQSGDVEVEDAGPVTFESVSGDVSGRQLRGRVRASSVSGELDLADVEGDVDAESTSGDITVSAARTKFVRAQTVSGEIVYGGAVDAAGRYEFHSHSGEIRLTLPENVGAQLGIETFSGEVDTAFPITLGPSARNAERPKRFEFTLGKGGARVTAETFSGDIVLERGEGR